MAISIGRVATLADNHNASADIYWASGGGAAPGALILLVATEESGVGPVTGGTNAWTERMSSSSDARMRVWSHIAAASEPDHYTVGYNEGALSIVMIELFGVDASPSESSSTNTGTHASNTSSNAGSATILVATECDGNSTSNYATPPSGYTLLGRITSHRGVDWQDTIAAIAAKLNVGTGSISPGTWTPTAGVSTSKIWAITFTPTATSSSGLLGKRRKTVEA